MKLLLLLPLLFLGVGGPRKSQCFSACSQCIVRCKQNSTNVEECRRTCLELKRMCCATCGKGPGPRTTCDCT